MKFVALVIFHFFINQLVKFYEFFILFPFALWGVREFFLIFFVLFLHFSKVGTIYI